MSEESKNPFQYTFIEQSKQWSRMFLKYNVQKRYQNWCIAKPGKEEPTSTRESYLGFISLIILWEGAVNIDCFNGRKTHGPHHSVS